MFRDCVLKDPSSRIMGFPQFCQCFGTACSQTQAVELQDFRSSVSVSGLRAHGPKQSNYRVSGVLSLFRDCVLKDPSSRIRVSAVLSLFSGMCAQRPKHSRIRVSGVFRDCARKDPSGPSGRIRVSGFPRCLGFRLGGFGFRVVE